MRALLCLFVIAAFVNVIASTDARAQFVCNGVSPSPTDLTCTNSGVETGALSTTSTILGAQAVTINSGLVQGDVGTLADGGGDATSRNTSAITGYLFTQTSNGAAGFGGGNAATYNAGVVDVIATITQDGGTALTVNSGRVLDLNNAYPSIPAGIATVTAFGGDATTINSGNVNGGIITATGLVSGAGSATTVNSGTVLGGINTISGFGGDASTINSGAVHGDVVTAANAVGNAAFVNYGTIDGNVLAVTPDGNATAYNGGRILGELDVIAGNAGMAALTNAGLIDSSSSTGVAIDLTQLSSATPTTLNILPGSRIVGEIILNGDVSDPSAVGTKINILSGHDISSVLTFGGCGCATGGLIDTGATVNVSGGAPYVVSGNTVAILDPTSFAMADRNVIDVTRTITSLVTSRLTNPAPIGGGTSSAIGFAPSGNVARDMANDAFSVIPALAYAGNDRVLLSNPSFTAADGTSVWAQGFGGQRIQRADAPTLRSVNNFYGGVLGVDRTVQPGLRLGGFIGAGNVKSTIELNSGDTKSDMVFGGVYGRYAMGRGFLDFSLLGGHNSNDVRRTIANNAVPGGYEYAAGKYNGWFISPEIAYGLTQSLGANLTLTPSARVRYLAAGFGGYDESGSSTNLSVGSRTSHNFEERGEFRLTHTTNATPAERLQLSGTAGLIALQRAGDSTVNTILLGQSLAFATPGKASLVGFYAGAGFDWRNVSGISVFAATEFTAMSDSSRTITGRGGVKVAF